MKRREFITLAGGAAAWPLAANAQQATGKIPHIAYLGALSLTTLDPRQIEQFKAGLVENGFIEGQNIVVDYIWAEGSPELLQRECSGLRVPCLPPCRTWLAVRVRGATTINSRNRSSERRNVATCRTSSSAISPSRLSALKR